MNKKTLLAAVLVIFSTVGAGADRFSVECSDKGGLLLERSEVSLTPQRGPYFEARFLLKYSKTEVYMRKLLNLSCAFDAQAAHCWNAQGQAFNFSVAGESGFGFDHSAPNKFKLANKLTYKTTFMFHPRPWAESGPDADKYQHLDFKSTNCQLTKIPAAESLIER